VTEGTTATRYAKAATSTIPIVMAQDPDPVGTGFVVSLARPGGNITGLSNMRAELSAKRVELLKDTIPRLSRVMVLGMLRTPGVARELAETERAAEAFAVRIEFHDTKSPQDIETAFQAASASRANAAIILGGPVLLSHRKRVVELAAQGRLPVMYHATDFVEDGGLMSYGVIIADLFRRAATYVDRILKGANPAALPIEQPTRVAFLVNLKAAKQIGLTIPSSVLVTADRVIE
jgi:putative ABC transport system substrate-binding protein